jgi:hypothetical protein
MYVDYDKKEKIINFLDNSFLKKLKYIGRGLEAAEIFTSYVKADYYNRGLQYNILVNTLWPSGRKHIKDVFSGREYGALDLLFGERLAETFKGIWDRATLYTYSTGYYRRSYRTDKATRLHLEKNINKLEEFTYLAASEFSLDKYLTDNKSGYEDVSVIADIISIEVDNNNREVMEKIKNIIYNDNNTAVVTRQIIQGLLMSRNEEGHRIIGELLLAARLQEGLRQSIVEGMDECSREGFMYLLKVILDNNLSRFSSVVRAFDTWTGLGIEAQKPKVINKCIEAAYRCLTDKDYKDECINSADNLLIYTGIWAVAFDEVEDIGTILEGLVDSDEKYKKLVALQFLHQTQFDIFKHKLACKALIEQDLEVLALALKNLFSGVGLYSLEREMESNIEEYYKLGGDFSGIKLFNNLKSVIDLMPKKELEFNESVFPWVNFKLSTTEVLDKMIFSTAKNFNSNIVDTLIDYKDKMSAETRFAFVSVFLKKPGNMKQKTFLIESCGDRSSSVRECAYKLVDKLALSAEDYLLMEGFLGYKSGDLRKNAIKLLLKQSSEELKASVGRLVLSNNENKRLGAIDIVSTIEHDKSHKKIYEECLELINSMEGKTQKEKLQVQNATAEQKDLRTLENGFGLFDKSKNMNIAAPVSSKDFSVKEIFVSTSGELEEILSKFSELLHENRDFEYEAEGWDDSKRKVTLGGSDYLEPMKRGDFKLENFPLSDEVRELARAIIPDATRIIEIDFYLESIYRVRYEAYQAWYEKLINDTFNFKALKAVLDKLEKISHFNKIKTYISLLGREVPKSESFNAAKGILEYLYSILPEDKHRKAYVKEERTYYFPGGKDYIAGSHEINHWLNLLQQSCVDDGGFSEYFTIAYSFYRACAYETGTTLTIEHFGRAMELGIVDENEVYKEFMARPLSPENIQSFTNRRHQEQDEFSRYTRFIGIGNRVVDVIAGIEVSRGELNTEVTHLAARINRCYGSHIFAAIILHLEKDNYVRGYNFVSGDSTKKQMLSHLLKCCYPLEGENETSLREYLKEKKVSNKQLIEAAMYSPQWLDIVSRYVGYEGLKSACWYFHAHVNDYFSEEKTAIVARYTPIPAQELKDGAFDRAWFMAAYNTLGEKNFKIVYDSAKYIAGGGLHRRSQLFSDAVLGRLDLEEVKDRIKSTRNKDYLLVYGLIPLKNKEDLLSRYELIHEFIKESKSFGAQRQASENRSANIALLNLAANAGYPDVNRLAWNMETEKLQSISQYLEPKAVEDIEIQLLINELGQAEIICRKDGKCLRDIPSKLKKQEYILELKAVKKSLKEQYSRARQSFEASMEKEDEFEMSELSNLCTNPVLSPIVKNLVFLQGKTLGYFNREGLVDYNGELHEIESQEKLIIAHPVHLYESGHWPQYQKEIFENKRLQPFKQVFRELYLPTADELQEQTVSRRYSGYQIQPRKAAALLKTRGWMASYEEGLQKIYYNKNIIATIYAMADWFSPSEVEAPTIEFVRFEDRKTFKPVPLNKVSKHIFSEVMRDIDMVVSVAHVGGVDPEASLSTVEIRKVVIEELTRLLKLNNVELKGNHAYIAGAYGEYTVHLGSGIVHKMGTGSINILPVHSQHRGRIFLPFIDEDPRSSEIVSKIVLLAEDKKLKDPSILVQVSG